MFQRSFLVAGFSIAILGGRTVFAEEPEPSAKKEASQREIRRLMNIVKKAPQPEVAERAIQDLYKLSIPHDDIRRALVWDYLLLDIDNAVRLRMCWRLIHSELSTSIVAAQTSGI